MFKKILLASDGSDQALHAAHVAALMAKELGATLTALYVYTPLARVTPFGAVSTVDLEPAVIESVQESVTERTAAEIKEVGVPFEMRCEIGYAAEVITRIADDDGYDLLVVGGRGLSGVRALFLGSVSDRVAHSTHCAVLIVK